MKRIIGLAATALVATSLATVAAPAQAHPAGDRAVPIGSVDAPRTVKAKGKTVLVLAKRSYKVAADGEKDLELTLTKPGRALLADGKVKVKAVQTAPGAERAVTTFWLTAAKG
jgi:hypothetical protein